MGNSKTLSGQLPGPRRGWNRARAWTSERLCLSAGSTDKLLSRHLSNPTLSPRRLSLRPAEALCVRALGRSNVLHPRVPGLFIGRCYRRDHPCLPIFADANAMRCHVWHERIQTDLPSIMNAAREAPERPCRILKAFKYTRAH